MKIIVTGGAGFVGSTVIRHIIHNTQHQVLNLDKLTYAGNLETLASICNDRGYSFAQGDICDAQHVRRLLQDFQPDAIMHLAAESHVDRSIDGAAEFIQTNIVGTYTLLEESRDYWQQLPSERQRKFRFHHVSTDEVYGDLSESSSRLFTEEHPYAPSSPYSASKAGSDHLVRAWQRTYGLPTLVSNCSNNYGPYQYPEKLVPLVIMNALSGRSLPVYGNGKQIRDWIYVDDHAEALLTVLMNGRVGETYNIGGHNEKSNLEVVWTICSILDELRPNPAGSYRKLIEFVEDRPGHDRRYAIDASKVGQDLCWRPAHSFESGLDKTIRWYLDHLDWCTRVDEKMSSQQRIGLGGSERW